MIDYTIQVHDIKGVVDSPSHEAISQACVQVFGDTSDHRLVRSVQADSHGRFDVEGLTKGRYYRLVVKAAGLCTANARILIVPYEPGQSTITVHMRPAGIDTCSYAELK